jgi:hypothetical protein
MSLDGTVPVDPWSIAWDCLEILGNIEYLARTTDAMTIEQKLYLGIMENELTRLKTALGEISYSMGEDAAN